MLGVIWVLGRSSGGLGAEGGLHPHTHLHPPDSPPQAQVLENILGYIQYLQTILSIAQGGAGNGDPPTSRDPLRDPYPKFLRTLPGTLHPLGPPDPLFCPPPSSSTGHP